LKQADKVGSYLKLVENIGDILKTKCMIALNVVLPFALPACPRGYHVCPNKAST